MGSLRAYIIKRILLTIPMILILLILVFILLRVMPGDPIRATMRPGVPQEYLDQIRHAQGLDRPMDINLRGSWVTVAKPFVVMYEEHEHSSLPVMLVLEEERLPITDRWTETGEDWIRVSAVKETPVWVAEGKLEWLRQVEFLYAPIEGATLPFEVEGNWV